jgi:hypothetical protein
MQMRFRKNDILKWLEVFYSPDPELIKDISENWVNYKVILIENIARIYTMIFSAPASQSLSLLVSIKNLRTFPRKKKQSGIIMSLKYLIN